MTIIGDRIRTMQLARIVREDYARTTESAYYKDWSYGHFDELINGLFGAYYASYPNSATSFKEFADELTAQSGIPYNPTEYVIKHYQSVLREQRKHGNVIKGFDVTELEMRSLFKNRLLVQPAKPYVNQFGERVPVLIAWFNAMAFVPALYSKLVMRPDGDLQYDELAATFGTNPNKNVASGEYFISAVGPDYQGLAFAGKYLEKMLPAMVRLFSGDVVGGFADIIKLDLAAYENLVERQRLDSLLFADEQTRFKNILTKERWAFNLFTKGGTKDPLSILLAELERVLNV